MPFASFIDFYERVIEAFKFDIVILRVVFLKVDLVYHWTYAICSFVKALTRKLLGDVVCILCIKVCNVDRYIVVIGVVIGIIDGAVIIVILGIYNWSSFAVALVVVSGFYAREGLHA